MTATTPDRLADLWDGCGVCSPEAELHRVRSLCEEAGVAAQGARVIETVGEHTIVAVPGAGLVARIGDLAAYGRLELELLAAAFLSSPEIAIPVVEPAADPPCRQLTVFGDRVLTWWRYAPGQRADLAGLGSALRRLHRVPAPTPGLRYLTLARLDPFARLQRQLRAAGNVPHADLRVLHRYIGQLADRWETSPLATAPSVVLHGDAHPANTVVEDGRVLLLDLEDVALGPADYDLRTILAFNRLGWNSDLELAGFLDAYGRPVAGQSAELLTDLSLAQMTSFTAAASLRFPHAVDQVRLRIASLADPSLYPGWWRTWRPEPAGR